MNSVFAFGFDFGYSLFICRLNYSHAMGKAQNGDSGTVQRQVLGSAGPKTLSRLQF